MTGPSNELLENINREWAEAESAIATAYSGLQAALTAGEIVRMERFRVVEKVFANGFILARILEPQAVTYEAGSHPDNWPGGNFSWRQLDEQHAEAISGSQAGNVQALIYPHAPEEDKKTSFLDFWIKGIHDNRGLQHLLRQGSFIPGSTHYRTDLDLHAIEWSLPPVK